MTFYLMVANIVAWMVVLGYSAPAVGSLLFTRRRRWGDPARLLTFVYAFLLISFTARRLVYPGDNTGIDMLFGLSIAVALYTVHLIRSYGRGRALGE